MLRYLSVMKTVLYVNKGLPTYNVRCETSVLHAALPEFSHVLKSKKTFSCVLFSHLLVIQLTGICHLRAISQT